MIKKGMVKRIVIGMIDNNLARIRIGILIYLNFV